MEDVYLLLQSHPSITELNIRLRPRYDTIIYTKEQLQAEAEFTILHMLANHPHLLKVYNIPTKQCFIKENDGSVIVSKF